MDETWILLCAAGALLTRVGLMLYLGGVVRAKNAAGTVLRVAADLCVVTLSFWAIGVAISHPAAGFLHIDWSLLAGGGQPVRTATTPILVGSIAGGAGTIRMLIVSLLASGIVVGAVSERMRFLPALWGSVLVGGLLVPVLGRWAWHGWLFERGYHDFAGASVVHVAGAMCAAVAAVMVGPRMGKYNRDGSANVIPGHNVPLASAGIMLMLVAWLPYVLSFAADSSGATPGAIAMNVIVAVAAAGLTSLLYGHWRFGKVDVYLVQAALLGGAVAITAGADVVSSRGAFAIGAVAGLIIPWVTVQLDLVWKIDDPSASIAPHAVGGIWGILSVGIIAPMDTVADRMKLIGLQALGLAVTTGAAIVAAAVLFFVVKRCTRIRSREADEFDGLDLAEHDIGAYPDFQQNTIKSYHLREA